MRRFLLILTAFLTIDNFASAQSEIDVVNFRKLRDKQFKDRNYSPLTAVDFSKFERLSYFPITENYLVKAIFAPTPDEKTFMMPTSTGTAHKYRKSGELKFKLDGANYSLSAYQRAYEENDTRMKKPILTLFVPFKDLSNGTETYGGGRYLSLPMPKETGAVIIDFNLAYNPSCAYGDPSFSCPIPPRENLLQVAINAGEKTYQITAQSK